MLSHLHSSSEACRPPLLGVLLLIRRRLSHDVQFAPLPHTCFAPRLVFCTVGKLLPSFMVGVTLSDSRLVTSQSCLCFVVIPKAFTMAFV